MIPKRKNFFGWAVWVDHKGGSRYQNKVLPRGYPFASHYGTHYASQ